MSTTKPTALSRRQLLTRIGLAAGVAYVAPVMVGMHAARASTNSAPSAPSRRSAPSQRSAPTRRSAPTAPSRRSAPSPASAPSRRSAPSRQSSPTRNSAPSRRSTPSRASVVNRSAPSSIRLTQRELDNCQRVQSRQPANGRDPIWVLRELGLC